MSIIDAMLNRWEISLENFSKEISKLSKNKYTTKYGNKRSIRLNNKTVKRFRKTGLDVSRAYALWTKEEDEQLLSAWFVNPSIKKLALKHNRTPNAVQVRLKRLGVYA